MAGAKKSKMKCHHRSGGGVVPRHRADRSRGPRSPSRFAASSRGVSGWLWLVRALGERSGISRIDSTDVIDAALKVWAKEVGLPEPPPRF